MTSSMLFISLVIILLMINSSAQISPCTQADANGCPPAGVWGEWKTVGNTKCDMDCGGCGTLYQERECLSESICSCTGSSTRYVACNFDVCKYPSQKSCCTPYLPMVLNGTYTCGPAPKTIENSACCPQKDLLSAWAGWELIGSQWTRTRKCLTASIECPCTGQTLTETRAACPCAQPADATVPCANVALGKPIYYRAIVVNDATCTADLILIGETQGNKTYCKTLTDGYGAARGFQGAMLIMREVSGTCTTDTVFDCSAGVDPVNKRQNGTFTCNPDTGNWVYDYTGKEINAIVQGVWL
ncbi:hypothetical protein CAEBREN_28851 [Caenorhabditis brenneri]|uniref:Uncharacterized protein n=1 Tax=Caenorhabditis brenneri TaxID=135651 RepID=G0NA76_CAEBE|nr:hypothetical protein CAEBREN_28851 [Caenorhabditis brenneri]